MAYKNIDEFISQLEKQGELLRVKGYVSPNLEITEIADRFVKEGGSALLFENTGTDFPVLINSMASDLRICHALGLSDLDEAGRRIAELMAKLMAPAPGFIDKLKILPTLSEVSDWMPKVNKGRGACQEVVMESPDLTKLPILTCWPHDGGPFITLPLVHTKDAETGVRNLGMYRMQVFSEKATGMHWHLHKNSARHYQQYKSSGKRMPVAVALGGDPVYTYAATAPLPDQIDEYLLAGFLRRRKVELVKCLTCDLEVPSDADFIIEGYVDPAEELAWEGPFGDHTGYYSLADFYPVFHVTCITHRKKAVYPATIVGIPPMEDGWIGKATERLFIMPIRLTMLPELVDMGMPVEGVFHNIVVVSIKKQFPGHAARVMSALWGAGQMMFNKILVVVDADVDVHDYSAVAECIVKNTNLAEDLHYSKGPMDVLDHASRRFAYGSKLGIDATAKWKGEVQSESSMALYLTGNPFQRLEGSGVIDVTLLSGLPILIVRFRRYATDDIRDCFERWIANDLIKGSGWVVFVEEGVSLERLGYLVWRIANNIDPLRDVFSSQKNNQIICVNASRKYPQWDNFDRDWPNIVTMSKEVIATIDSKWSSLGLGEFISSPSLPFLSELYKGGAVAE